MARRILAWILLAGFILLILNIVFIGFQRAASVIIYIVIALAYVFLSGAGKKKNRE